MKRLALALGQIAIVIWASFIVYGHDIHRLTELVPYLAALFLRGWFSKDVNDPIFGRQSIIELIKSALKRLTPRRQPKIKWDI